MRISIRCLILVILALPLIMVGCTCSHHPAEPAQAIDNTEPDINEMPTDDDAIPAPEDTTQDRTQPDQGGAQQSPSESN